MTLRTTILAGFAAASLSILGGPVHAQSTKAELTVYKSPQCGCCTKWADHMDENGFDSTALNRHDMATLKASLGVPSGLQSCHTGQVKDYVFEGHIPADVVKRFLENPPEDAYGLAVPGMPIGSPGMEMGTRHQDYDVILLKRSGKHEVYTRVSQHGAP